MALCGYKAHIITNTFSEASLPSIFEYVWSCSSGKWMGSLFLKNQGLMAIPGKKKPARTFPWTSVQDIFESLLLWTSATHWLHSWHIFLGSEPFDPFHSETLNGSYPDRRCVASKPHDDWFNHVKGHGHGKPLTLLGTIDTTRNHWQY